MEIQAKTKMLSVVKDRAKNYNKLLKSYRKDSNFLLGDHLNCALNIPEDFDFSKLDGEFFKQKNPQGFSLPLSNQTFEKLRKLPKRAINSYFVENNNGKEIFGQYLVGVINKKPILYAFSIVIDEKDTDKFSIKLDACIRGQDWINLTRFDSKGPPHPNYITKDGSVVTSIDKLQMCPTPHLHINSQEAQVIFGDSLDYSTAVHIPREKICETENSNEFLINSVQYFMESINLQETFNTKLFDGDKTYQQDLFVSDDRKFMYHSNDVKEL